MWFYYLVDAKSTEAFRSRIFDVWSGLISIFILLHPAKVFSHAGGGIHKWFLVQVFIWTTAELILGLHINDLAVAHARSAAVDHFTAFVKHNLR
jgi:hypothetical protein